MRFTQGGIAAIAVASLGLGTLALAADKGLVVPNSRKVVPPPDKRAVEFEAPAEITVECPEAITVEMGPLESKLPQWETVESGLVIIRQPRVGVRSSGSMLTELTCRYQVEDQMLGVVRIRRPIHHSGAQFWCVPAPGNPGKAVCKSK